MGNEHRRPAFGEFGKSDKHIVLRAGIQRRRRFIQNKQLSIAHIGATQRNFLPLTATEINSTFKSTSEHGIISPGEFGHNLIGQAALSRTLFPIGHLPKPEVRRIAEEAGLPTFAKKDSTGICFIGERRFREFLSRYVAAQPGDIETPEGQRIGQHQGVCYYTIGQREGLGIGGVRGFPEAPWFVVGKDLARNVLIAVQGTEHPLLFSQRLTAHTPNWIAGAAPGASFRCTAKTRYRQPDQDCAVEWRDDGTLAVQFDEPQRAVTPGQSVVFYRDEECLGGAVIEATDAAYGGLT